MKKTTQQTIARVLNSVPGLTAIMIDKGLTATERDIATLMVGGYSQRDIAGMLGTHRSIIQANLEKMRARLRPQQVQSL